MLVVLRRHVEHADARAVPGRRQLDALLGRFAGGAVDARRCFARVPHFEEQRAMLAADARHAWSGRILDDDGAAQRVMAGDDAAERRAQLLFAHVGAPA